MGMSSELLVFVTRSFEILGSIIMSHVFIISSGDLLPFWVRLSANCWIKRGYVIIIIGICYKIFRDFW